MTVRKDVDGRTSHNSDIGNGVASIVGWKMAVDGGRKDTEPVVQGHDEESDERCEDSELHARSNLYRSPISSKSPDGRFPWLDEKGHTSRRVMLGIVDTPGQF